MFEPDEEHYVEHVFINFSKRQIKIVDEEGYDKVVEWKWDQEGTEGFAETVHMISSTMPEEHVTYMFAALEHNK